MMSQLMKTKTTKLRKKRSTQLLRECWSFLTKLMTCQNLHNKLLNITILFIWYLLASLKKMSLAKHGELYLILASTSFSPLAILASVWKKWFPTLNESIWMMRECIWKPSDAVDLIHSFELKICLHLEYTFVHVQCTTKTKSGPTWYTQSRSDTCFVQSLSMKTIIPTWQWHKHSLITDHSLLKFVAKLTSETVLLKCAKYLKMLELTLNDYQHFWKQGLVFFLKEKAMVLTS